MASTKNPNARNRILRRPAVLEKLSVSATTLWRMQKAGLFLAPFRISPGLVGWCETDVDEWIERKRHAQTTRASRPSPSDPSTS